MQNAHHKISRIRQPKGLLFFGRLDVFSGISRLKPGPIGGRHATLRLLGFGGQSRAH